MTKNELKEKALSLPLVPGVYIMQNAQNEVIYVGKAKKLKNRVSQYFIDTVSHTPKTRLMVSKIDHFDVIMAASEFEALVLECSLIKRHMPKYNILLKDDKGYPYLRLDLREDYPVMTLASKAVDDGAKYFGPFGGRYLTQKVMDTLRLAFRLPGWSDAAYRPDPQGRGLVEKNGYLYISGRWQEGDRITLDFPMPVLPLRSHPLVRETRRQICYARGPLVFCAEEADNGGLLHLIRALPGEAPSVGRREIQGVELPVITVPARRLKAAGAGLYTRWAEPEEEDCTLTLIPYFAWCNRAPGEMRVWLDV